MNGAGTSTTMIRVEYQCTFDDFREASLGARAGMQRASAPRTVWRRLLIWAMFLTLAALTFALLKWFGWPLPFALPALIADPQTTVRATSGWPLAVRFARAGLLSWLVLGLLLLNVVVGAFRAPTHPWDPPAVRNKWRWGLVRWLIPFIVVPPLLGWIWAADALRNRAANPWPDTAPDLYDYALGTVPIMLMTALISAFYRLNRGRALRHRWAGLEHLHRHCSLTASDAGVTFQEELSRHEHAWNYFPGYRETANLLLLYNSSQGFWIIPKRAFVEPSALTRFKGLLVTHVKHGSLLPTMSAFPVMPLAGGSPMPVIAATPTPDGRAV